MPDPKRASATHLTALTAVPAGLLQVGDCPVSLAGWRPITRIQVRPRVGTVILWTAEGKHTKDQRGRPITVDTPIMTRKHQ